MAENVQVPVPCPTCGYEGDWDENELWDYHYCPECGHTVTA